MNKVLVNKIQYAIYSPFVWVILFLKGIKCKGISYWNGFPYISKAKGTNIYIGKKCRFASKKTSNLIGINHRCMISTVKGSSGISIGTSCGFSGVTIWCFKEVIIGNNVRVGANVTIMDGDCHQEDPRSGQDAPVVIEDNVWIGAGVLILKGVHIGRNSLIGAGSVVSKNIQENVIAAGNPCRAVRNLDPEVIKKLEMKAKE